MDSTNTRSFFKYQSSQESSESGESEIRVSNSPLTGKDVQSSLTNDNHVMRSDSDESDEEDSLYNDSGYDDEIIKDVELHVGVVVQQQMEVQKPPEEGILEETEEDRVQESPIYATQEPRKRNNENVVGPSNLVTQEIQEGESEFPTIALSIVNDNDCFLELFSTAWAQETPGDNNKNTLIKTTKRKQARNLSPLTTTIETPNGKIGNSTDYNMVENISDKQEAFRRWQVGRCVGMRTNDENKERPNTDIPKLRREASYQVFFYLFNEYCRI